MKTGVELITEIAECSSYIEEHPIGAHTQDAIERRKELRKQLEILPDLSFS